MRVPWTARRLNKSILKEINPEYSLFREGLTLKLKLQYLGHLMQRANSSGKVPDAGNKGERCGKDEMVGWHHRLNGHEFEKTPRDSEGQGSLAGCGLWNRRLGHDLVTEQQQQN